MCDNCDLDCTSVHSFKKHKAKCTTKKGKDTATQQSRPKHPPTATISRPPTVQDTVTQDTQSNVSSLEQQRNISPHTVRNTESSYIPGSLTAEVLAELDTVLSEISFQELSVIN
jgi:hypothetical protein